ncbi:hypothetical protein EYF80_011216 [Liparis tanakae]|uniref:Uncharacterized protein n=1 Tax=Liparis tanakae TaxID=230148 RepID=A0A4Z2ILF8_9TELE|nr:hypothetical protein EYF80_011216 [Liparis tanakae]
MYPKSFGKEQGGKIDLGGAMSEDAQGRKEGREGFLICIKQGLHKHIDLTSRHRGSEPRQLEDPEPPLL